MDERASEPTCSRDLDPELYERTSLLRNWTDGHPDKPLAVKEQNFRQDEEHGKEEK